VEKFSKGPSLTPLRPSALEKKVLTLIRYVSWMLFATVVANAGGHCQVPAALS
jgi:hypothetical protein